MAAVEPFQVLEVFGVVVFAFTGALAGLRARMDVVGTMVMSFIVGLGGGTIRDLLLGRHPLGWMRDEWMLWLALLTGAVVFLGFRLLARHDDPPSERSMLGVALIWGDAVGISVFCVSGAQVALIMGASNLVAILMGAITCAGGGILRDMLVNEVPLVLRGDLYMTPALIGAGIYVGIDYAGAAGTAVVVAASVCFAVRALAIRYKLNPPR